MPSINTEILTHLLNSHKNLHFIYEKTDTHNSISPWPRSSKQCNQDSNQAWGSKPTNLTKHCMLSAKLPHHSIRGQSRSSKQSLKNVLACVKQYCMEKNNTADT